jgi:uncharacterized protein (DUF885 family)
MKTKFVVGSVVVLALLFSTPRLRADSLDDLAKDFWGWRASEQPLSTDDIPRIERAATWLPVWSTAAVARYRQQLAEFEARWQKIDASSWPVARQVDYRLMGSAIARVRWELEVLRNWQRDPMFYVDQSAGAYFHLLLPPPPFDAARSRQIVATLNAIPRIVQEGESNLSDARAPFAGLALDALDGVRPKFLTSVKELKPFLNADAAAGLDAAAEQAIAAMEAYREWVKQRLPAMNADTAVGREGYVFFLHKVALLPFTPEQLLSMGQQEWARAVASQSYEEHRNIGLPQLPLFKDEARQDEVEEQQELAVRRYLEVKDILTVPAAVQHYRMAPMPAYLAPVAGFGEDDDFTSPSRLKENGTRYVNPPRADLGYFALTTAKDPRGEIVHEGVPGHYFQLALGWMNPDFIRRFYYDSSANEGLGFYAEEMMMNAGLCDDSPRTREFLWSFMRLRALRVEVDVKLALGEFSMEQAAEYLQKSVPMDSVTAHGEAALFASTPGQAISYEIGKLQIYKFLADAHRAKGDGFSLRAFHDFLWGNGNVPIALQRWEYLGMRDEVEEGERVR